MHYKNSKEELKQIQESIDSMRSKMYEVGGFDESESIVITDEAINVSQKLDVLIVKYYQKKYD